MWVTCKILVKKKKTKVLVTFYYHFSFKKWNQSENTVHNDVGFNAKNNKAKIKKSYKKYAILENAYLKLDKGNYFKTIFNNNNFVNNVTKNKVNNSNNEIHKHFQRYNKLIYTLTM